MNTFVGLVIGVLLAASGMLYGHKNKLHKKIAVTLFVIAAALSIILGIKTCTESGTSNLPPQNVSINTSNQQGNNTGIVNNFAQPPRAITDQQEDLFKSEIIPATGCTVQVAVYGDSAEVAQYTKRLAEIIHNAGYAVTGGYQAGWPDIAAGITIRRKQDPDPNAAKFQKAFQKIGIEPRLLPPEPNLPDNFIEIVVGEREP